jgi:transcriptional regulator with XRE-family HTH domain
MTTDSGDNPTLRQQLGALLRRLRDLAGMSGRELAPQVGISQSTLARIEAGDRAPSIPEVIAWCAATNAPEESQAQLTHLAEAAKTEIAPWRSALRHGQTHMQDQARQLEETGRTIRVCEHSLIPALLQTASYAQALFPLVTRDIPGHDHAAAVTARMRRQEALYDSAKRFEFLVTEAALRWAPGSTKLLAAQHAKLQSLLTLDNVSVGVLPLTTTAGPFSSFTIYDDHTDAAPPVVAVELPHARLTLDDPHDVAVYRETFARWRESALLGSEAELFVRDLAVELA